MLQIKFGSGGIAERSEKGRVSLPKKRRTRQHVIADLSVNHVERHALLCGYSVERPEHDYGIDLVLFTYDANGEIENGEIKIQLKATDHPRVLVDRQTISFPVERSDLELWLKEPLPYILIVYDAQTDVAYWIYLQAYFENLPQFDLAKAARKVTIHLQKKNVVDEAAMRGFAQYRNDVLNQVQGVIRHNA